MSKIGVRKLITKRALEVYESEDYKKNLIRSQYRTGCCKMKIKFIRKFIVVFIGLILILFIYNQVVKLDLEQT